MGFLYHFHREFQEGDLPCVIHSLNESHERILSIAHLVQQPATHGIKRFMQNFLAHFRPFESESVFQQRQKARAVFGEPVKKALGFSGKSLRTDFIVNGRPYDFRFLRFHPAAAHAHHVHLIHQFTEEKKIKPGIAKSINAAVRFIHHPCHLRRIADIVTGKGRQVAHGRKGRGAFHEKAASLPWTGKPLL